ncbi:c-type cytochrome [Magnetospira sp. QH-2]|uniref:c-type cytochrome n=1 Tax=Magnetospira sp. (strain QH-2) TaxID=1288970 RepID=UPI0003E81015|nr:c-type cytochrome [Magnetospira sp. QH-2]CCQ73143.1 Putative cytochrome c, class I [Magnetospira sp. QH-2]
MLLVLLAALPARAEPEVLGDPLDGEDIFITCAPCHGDQAQGGGGGKYPRLAGMSQKVLAEQLRDFKSRERTNIPMFPFTSERELSDQDILDVTAFITSITLRTYLPPVEGRVDGLERLLAAKRVLQIPRAPGDLKRGRDLYGQYECGRCHGEQGEGGPSDPLLAGQHIPYLERQFERMAKDERFHPKPDRYIAPLSAEDIQNLLAYISVLDDPVPPKI